jgi:[DsrC]-trisulfide reductase subunit J
MLRLFVSVLAILGLVAGAVHAASDDVPSYGVEVPKAVGDPHPEGNEFMRINHMNLLKHDRTDTLRLGDRAIEFSLKGCVACHAVNGVKGEPIGYDDPQYFCRVCHDYVAIKVDCFTCHKATPDEDILNRLLKAQNAQLTPVDKAKQDAELAAYIEGVSESTGDQLVQRQDETEEVAQ